jgi:hypothetical protein
MAANECDAFLTECETVYNKFIHSLNSSLNLKTTIKSELTSCANEFKQLVLKQHNLIKNQENVIFSETSAQRDRHLDALEIITNDLKSIKYELSSKTTYSSILK